MIFYTTYFIDFYYDLLMNDFEKMTIIFENLFFKSIIE